jgi:hypothetical protein
VNCCVVPKGIDGLAGMTVIDTSAAGVTVSVVVPLTLPTEALMVALPIAALCARPIEATVTTAVELEAQVAVLVRFCVVESV